MSPVGTSLGSATDAELLAELSARFPPRHRQHYPLPFFRFLNGYRPQLAMDVVVFRTAASGQEVLLRHRLATDVGYEGMPHLPGAYLLNGERPMDCAARIVHDEIGAAVQLTRLEFAGLLFNRYELRGHFVHCTFWAQLYGDAKLNPECFWASTAALPANLVPHQYQSIAAAAAVHRGSPPSFLAEYNE